MTYLTFIIDNYASLPTAGIVFIHGSRFAWHNDHPQYDNLALLRDLNIESALGGGSGYHNLRCDWSLSTCPRDVRPQGSIENRVQAVLVPYDDRAVSDSLLPKALVSIFGGGDGDGDWREGEEEGKEHVPTNPPKWASSDILKSQCCAQFVVSRTAILQHGREEYIALRQWLLDDGPNAAPRNDKHAGRIMSYLWHVLFIDREVVGVGAGGVGGVGKGGNDGVGNDGLGNTSVRKNSLHLASLNREACPSAEECYCRVYGRCGLTGCKTGSCKGQYKLPKNLKVPDGWKGGEELK